MGDINYAEEIVKKGYLIQQGEAQASNISEEIKDLKGVDTYREGNLYLFYLKGYEQKAFKALEKHKEKSNTYYTSFYEDNESVYLEVFDKANGMEKFLKVKKTDKSKEFVEEITLKDKTLLPISLSRDKSGTLLKNVIMPTTEIVKHNVVEIDPLYHKIKVFLSKYFDIDELDLEIIATFSLLTWIQTKLGIIPYLKFQSDTGKGKSRALDCLAELVYFAELSSGCSSFSGMARTHQLWKGTMIIDEADFEGLESSKIEKYLQLGYQKDKVYTLSDKKDPKLQEVFEPFGAKILGMRYAFKNPATEGRCLTIQTKETKRKDIPPILPKAFYAEGEEIRNMICNYFAENWSKIDPDNTLDFQEMQIEPRLRQLAMPYSIIFQLRSNGVQKFREYLILRQKSLIRARASSIEGILFNAWVDLATEPNNLPAEFKEKMIDDSQLVGITSAILYKLTGISQIEVGRKLGALGMKQKVIKNRSHSHRIWIIPTETDAIEMFGRYYYDEEMRSPEVLTRDLLLKLQGLAGEFPRFTDSKSVNLTDSYAKSKFVRNFVEKFDNNLDPQSKISVECVENVESYSKTSTDTTDSTDKTDVRSKSDAICEFCSNYAPCTLHNGKYACQGCLDSLQADFTG